MLSRTKNEMNCEVLQHRKKQRNEFCISRSAAFCYGIVGLYYRILANRSTALVKRAMVTSALPCSIPSRTQC